MCGGNKVKERANALARYQQRNKKSSNDFSDIRDPTLRARMQASAQYLGNNRSKGKSGRSSRKTKGKSGSRQTRTQTNTANRTRKSSPGMIQRVRNAIRRVTGNIRNRSSNRG